MNRDNFLFTVGGLLVGFIVGYIGHEVMLERQPVRLLPGSPAAVAAAAQGPVVGGGSANAPESATAAMERVQRLRAHVEANPDDKESLLLLANMNFDIRNWSRAVELYERHLSLVPDNPEVMNDLGISRRALGESQAALEIFEQIERLNPEYWKGYYTQVIILAFDLGDLDRAQPKLETLLRLAPNNPEVERLAAEVERRRQG